MKAEFVANGGEFLDKPISEFFTIQSNPQLNKDSFSFSGNGKYPYFTRTVFNNGIAGYVDYLDDEHKIKGNCLAVGMIAMQFFYMEHDFYAGQFTKSVYPKTDKISRFNSKIALYFIALFNRLQHKLQGGLVRDFEKSLLSSLVNLPFKNGKICLDYMERFVQQLHAERVQELHAFLKVSNLIDVNLSKDEQTALKSVGWLENPTPAAPENSGSLKEFAIKDLFTNIQQGERLTKADQISGSLNFVMSGTTNTGVVGSIGNQITRFPNNAITIDIFGNVFYRNYEFGASDDVGVYWNDKNNALNKHAMLYLAASLQKSLAGRFDYGYKLRASKSHDLTCLLPEKDGKPDTKLMSQIGRAIEKLVIADVAAYAEREQNAYQQTIQAAL